MKLAGISLHERRLEGALFLALAFVYLASPNRHLSDSRFTLLTSEAVLHHGSLDLTPFAVVEAPNRGTPPQLIHWRGQLITFHPAGTSILAIPLVLTARIAGIRVLDSEGRYDEASEARLQRIAAALMSAGTGVLLYALARRELPRGRALVIAVSAALGTSLWSTASRVLWSQTGAVLFLSAALLGMRDLDDANRSNPCRLAFLLLLAVWVRPSVAPIACLFAADILLRRRHLARSFALATTLGLASLLTLHRALAGTFLPVYVMAHAKASRGATGFVEAMVGHLISPSRGLLVFSPIVLAAFWLPLRHGVRPLQWGTARLCVLACCVHWTLASLPCVWWGGGSYGPRLMLEVVPFLVALASLGWRRALDAGTAPRSRLLRIVGASLVATSLYMHATGALSRASLQWNARPVPVSRQPQRVWDWRDPQFLAWTDRKALPKELWPPASNMPCPPLLEEPPDATSRDTSAPRARTAC